MLNRSIHPDYLVHWTGRDIDELCEGDEHWTKHPKGHSKTPYEQKNAYLNRLRSILEYGLWMTSDSEEQLASEFGKYAPPPAARCCFTELRLSETREHAVLYGRLGIGVKRPFLFDRAGRPMIYVGFNFERTNDPIIEACYSDLKEKRLMHFFKPMNSDIKKLDYDLYSESEWRIINIDHLKDSRIIDPRDTKFSKYKEYWKALPENQRDKLKYLVPLDGWFSMIIYPSIEARLAAQSDPDIPRLIKSLKNQRTNFAGIQDHGNYVERGIHPIEMNLDSCREF